MTRTQLKLFEPLVKALGRTLRDEWATRDAKIAALEARIAALEATQRHETTVNARGHVAAPRKRHDDDRQTDRSHVGNLIDGIPAWMDQIVGDKVRELQTAAVIGDIDPDAVSALVDEHRLRWETQRAQLRRDLARQVR